MFLRQGVVVDVLYVKRMVDSYGPDAVDVSGETLSVFAALESEHPVGVIGLVASDEDMSGLAEVTSDVIGIKDFKSLPRFIYIEGGLFSTQFSGRPRPRVPLSLIWSVVAEGGGVVIGDVSAAHVRSPGLGGMYQTHGALLGAWPLAGPDSSCYEITRRTSRAGGDGRRLFLDPEDVLDPGTEYAVAVQPFLEGVENIALEFAIVLRTTGEPLLYRPFNGLEVDTSDVPGSMTQGDAILASVRRHGDGFVAMIGGGFTYLADESNDNGQLIRNMLNSVLTA